MASIEKPYVLLVAELIYLEVCEIKKKSESDEDEECGYVSEEGVNK